MKIGDFVRIVNSPQPAKGGCYTAPNIWYVEKASDPNAISISNGVGSMIVPQIQLELLNLYETLDFYASMQKMTSSLEQVLQDAKNDPSKAADVAAVETTLKESQRRDEFVIQRNDTSWFGEPMPTSYQDLLDRDSFLRMPAYEYLRDMRVKPLIDSLIMPSIALLTAKKMRHNSMERGTFDFDRASMELLPRFQFYSAKHKSYHEKSEVQTTIEAEKSSYRLKSDNSEVYLVPYLSDGIDEQKREKILDQIVAGQNPLATMKEFGERPSKWYSTVKKSYVDYEMLPMPKNAIRIFVSIGGSSGKTGEQLMFTGMAVSAVTELLESIGFSVSIMVAIGVERPTMHHSQSRRYAMWENKRFTDSMDIPRLLYVLSDPTFFRVKMFRQYRLLSLKHGDAVYPSIGYAIGQEEFTNAVFRNFRWRDKNKDCMYFAITGVYSEGDVIDELRRIIGCALLENITHKQNAGMYRNRDEMLREAKIAEQIRTGNPR